MKFFINRFFFAKVLDKSVITVYTVYIQYTRGGKK